MWDGHLESQKDPDRLKRSLRDNVVYWKTTGKINNREIMLFIAKLMGRSIMISNVTHPLKRSIHVDRIYI